MKRRMVVGTFQTPYIRHGGIGTGQLQQPYIALAEHKSWNWVGRCAEPTNKAPGLASNLFELHLAGQPEGGRRVAAGREG